MEKNDFSKPVIVTIILLSLFSLFLCGISPSILKKEVGSFNTYCDSTSDTIM